MQTLEKAGNVVGYMGDGINDAPSLNSAEVGVSVDTAVDITKRNGRYNSFKEKFKCFNRWSY